MYEQPPVLTGGPVGRGLDRVVHTALAKRPDDRYQTAEAMAQDIRAALAASDTGSTAVTRAVTRLIVLPFRSLRPDPDTDFLAFSLADAITSALSGLQSLVVRSSLAASRFASESPDLAGHCRDRRRSMPCSSARCSAPATSCACRRSSWMLPAATVLWSQTTQVPVGDLFSLQDELTGKIVESLSLPLTARERQMLKQDVPLDAAGLRALPARERDEPRQRTVAGRPRSLRAVRRRGSAIRAGVGGRRPDAPDDRQVRRTRNPRSGSRAPRLPSGGRSSSIPDLSAAENVYAHLEVDLGRAEEAMVRLLRRARERAGRSRALCRAVARVPLLRAAAAVAGRGRSRRAGSIHASARAARTPISCSATTRACSISRPRRFLTCEISRW